MKITDIIAADTQAVVDAQAVLDTANAKLHADQESFASMQPHLSLLDQIEAALLHVEDGVEATAATALDAIKGNISPLIERMRTLFTGE